MNIFNVIFSARKINQGRRFSGNSANLFLINCKLEKIKIYMFKKYFKKIKNGLHRSRVILVTNSQDKVYVYFLPG
jgi:hypothetical protein